MCTKFKNNSCAVFIFHFENGLTEFRNTFISVFVIIRLLVFNYESIRHFYLEPGVQHPLYKFKFLFPPAGWIMFYQVSDSFGHTEVYGIKGQETRLIDPHEIIRTRTIGYDNIHRNILSAVSDRRVGAMFCRYLKTRFPDFDNFAVMSVWYPAITTEPHKRLQQVDYVCEEQK